MGSFNSGSHRIRLRYSKTGKAKYISHLDLLATMRRAFLRAGLELKYSEGFNPHPYISVALPLPVGSASVCELLDFDVSCAQGTEAIPGLINAVLPEGIEVIRAYLPVRKFSEIQWVELSGKLFYDEATTPCTAEILAEHFAAESIVVPKKTKSGTSSIDIAPFIRGIVVGNGGPQVMDTKNVSYTRNNTLSNREKEISILTMNVRISAQNPAITPAMLLRSFDDNKRTPEPYMSEFTRVEVFDGEMKVFG